MLFSNICLVVSAVHSHLKIPFLATHLKGKCWAEKMTCVFWELHRSLPVLLCSVNSVCCCVDEKSNNSILEKLLLQNTVQVSYWSSASSCFSVVKFWFFLHFWNAALQLKVGCLATQTLTERPVSYCPLEWVWLLMGHVKAWWWDTKQFRYSPNGWLTKWQLYRY